MQIWCFLCLHRSFWQFAKKERPDQKPSKAGDETRKSEEATETKHRQRHNHSSSGSLTSWRRKETLGQSASTASPHGAITVLDRAQWLVTKTKWTLFLPGKRKSWSISLKFFSTLKSYDSNVTYIILILTKSPRCKRLSHKSQEIQKTSKDNTDQVLKNLWKG